MSNCGKALVLKFVEEVVNRGNPRLLRALVSPDHVRHTSDGDLYGPEGVGIHIGEWRAGFPDLRVVVEDLIAEGDRVVSRFVLRGTHAGPFLWVPATGRAVAAAGVAVDRLAGNRLAESWVTLDVLGLLLQIGAVPGLPEPA